MKNRKFGFTLIEIMFVVFIISLLLSLVALEGMKLRRMANEMNAQANLKSIATSFEVYAAGHDGSYAASAVDNLQYLVDGKYAAQDFTTLDQVANFRYVSGSIGPVGYDIRAMAVNPVLAEHNYQIVTGAKILRSDTSLPNDTNFKNF
jgi:prepilin-type N-terminal cleavage/methylation domain-containing protein